MAPLRDLKGVGPLRREAAEQGYGFVARLVEEWESGANRFDRPAECYLGAWVDGRLVGVGGLNVDPDLIDRSAGRVRHLYVLQGWRGRGIGTALVETIVAAARGPFDILRLRTRGAGRFYERLGFSPVADPTATHAMLLGGDSRGSEGGSLDRQAADRS